MRDKISIAIIMTVFNRVEKTKMCIDSILDENIDNNYNFEFYITNDGSTDDTINLLSKYSTKFTEYKFNILNGTGKLFWNKGMFLAYGAALKKKVDYYLWVNNDVQFKKGFIEKIIKDAKKAQEQNRFIIICGSVSYFNAHELSYGGSLNLSKINPYKRKMLIPNGEIQACDCINGNCLLIPYETAIKLGNVDERYEHGFGDFDYGYKLKTINGQSFVASDYVGYCDRNSIEGTWKDVSIPIKQRIIKKNSPNGQPFYSHKIFLKKWFPAIWPYYLYMPYINIIVTSIKYKVKEKLK